MRLFKKYVIFRDLFRRGSIADKGRDIASSYLNAAPRKLKGKKREAAMRNAIHYLDKECRSVTRELRLGVYGKARLIKSVQGELLASEMNDDLALDVIEGLTKRIAGW